MITNDEEYDKAIETIIAMMKTADPEEIYKLAEEIEIYEEQRKELLWKK